MGPTLGPFDEYLQHVYNTLTAGQDGKAEVAVYMKYPDERKSGWYLNAPFGNPDEWWSDLVIWAEMKE